MEKVAFVRTHNSCRSQIAETLGRRLRGDEFEFYSAGTEPTAQVNVTAVRLMRERYGVELGGYAPKDWADPLPLPSEAAQDCLLIADYLERVIASAEEQGLIPDDSIAFDNIDDAIAFLESLWVAGLLPDLGRKDPEVASGYCSH